MKTICTDVYTLDELNDDAKERAREWYREACAGDTSSAEWVIDDAKACLKFCGWDVSKVYYSGFWSQGDGACFEGTWSAASVSAAKLKKHAPQDAELHRIADGLQALADQFPQASARVKQRGHYMHEYGTEFSVSLGHEEDEDGDEREISDATAEDAIVELSRDAMRWIYRQLEADYEYQNSDEQADESIRANEYTFTENGKRFG